MDAFYNVYFSSFDLLAADMAWYQATKTNQHMWEIGSL